MRKGFRYIWVGIFVLVTITLIAAFYLGQFLLSHPEFLSKQNHLLTIIGLLLIGISGLAFSFYRSQKNRWLKMIEHADVDYLTGLPNQNKLLKDLQDSQHTNLALLKFNNYYNILSTYGPAITDGVIKQVATVINNFRHPLLQKSCCYYIQQEVFAVLEDQETSLDDIVAIAKDMVNLITSTKYRVGDNEHIALNITIGAVRQNKDAFALANMALQEAEKRKMLFYVIDQSNSLIPETYKRDLVLTQSLIQGIQQHRLIAYFQPIFTRADKTVAKYECLARLLDAQQQIEMMPNAFMPLAHHANIYYMITRVMVSQAVKFAQQHQVVVTINISMTDINNKKTCEDIYEKVKSSGVGKYIQFELLENEAIIESYRIEKFIKNVHELGCQVGMDDMGKGHSNIERLINLPIDFVKIDRSIMENVTQNLEMQNVARGIVKLAHKKGVKVVAEYCADAHITSLAQDMGVDYLQGNYLGKPARQVWQPKQAMLSA